MAVAILLYKRPTDPLPINPADAAAYLAGARPSSSWLPFTVTLGVPLFCPLLCQQICNNMADRRCLSAAGQAGWRAAQQHLQQQLWQLMLQYGVPSGGKSKLEMSQQLPGSSIMSDPAHNPLAAAVEVTLGLELPARCLLFDGTSLVAVDMEECLQGVSLW